MWYKTENIFLQIHLWSRNATPLHVRNHPRRRRAALPHSLKPEWRATTPPVRLKYCTQKNPASSIRPLNSSFTETTHFSEIHKVTKLFETRKTLMSNSEEKSVFRKCNRNYEIVYFCCFYFQPLKMFFHSMTIISRQFLNQAGLLPGQETCGCSPPNTGKISSLQRSLLPKLGSPGSCRHRRA